MTSFITKCCDHQLNPPCFRQLQSFEFGEIGQYRRDGTRQPLALQV